MTLERVAERLSLSCGGFCTGIGVAALIEGYRMSTMALINGAILLFVGIAYAVRGDAKAEVK